MTGLREYHHYEYTMSSWRTLKTSRSTQSWATVLTPHALMSRCRPLLEDHSQLVSCFQACVPNSAAFKHTKSNSATWRLCSKARSNDWYLPFVGTVPMARMKTGTSRCLSGKSLCDWKVANLVQSWVGASDVTSISTL
jgi:hypothetical protein